MNQLLQNHALVLHCQSAVRRILYSQIDCLYIDLLTSTDLALVTPKEVLGSFTREGTLFSNLFVRAKSAQSQLILSKSVGKSIVSTTEVDSSS